ncbi:uncharacterized protein [Pseudochaenichthys georgianus]|uniref:uncharacterized protein isoform X1 n=1 Tax=Pseudochaenichthys georgianus TaxID=52239 RepID=UPI00146CB72E|nr:uncharacterized protein LOC117466805 isoform X1 [Pseudochaenichthys georgianus]
MYLENSDQSKAPGEGEPSTQAIIAEQCQDPKLTEAADLTSPSKGSAELGMEVLVEYTEQTVISKESEPSILCVEHCNTDRDETETYCNGHSEGCEQYPDRFFESHQVLDQCETSGLSQSLDDFECFKPLKSSQHCDNHSLASKCTSCCEHCAEHLQLFQQCKPPDQQLEAFDFEPDTLAVNCGSLEQCDMSDFTPECTEHLEFLQQYEPSGQQSACFDSEPDTSAEDSEQCEMTGGLTPDISDSVDLLDCGTELCENNECANDEDEERCPPKQDDEQYETETIDDESSTLSEDSNSSDIDTPVHAYFDDCENVGFASECCAVQQLTEDNCLQAPDMSTEDSEMCETDYSETNQQCASSMQCTDQFGTEDDSSDCSSIETKSFKTCPDCSIPSNQCSDSSEESEKEPQEDDGNDEDEGSDEQTLWESFEDDEEMDPINMNAMNEDIKKTPTADIVIEEYFNLFDSGDYYGHAFAKKQRYISCFDGGDMHDSIATSEAQKLAQTKYRSNEINEDIHVQETDTCFDASDGQEYEDSSEEDASQRDDVSSGSEQQQEYWSVESESSLAGDENEENNDDLYAENNEEEECDEDLYNNDESEACLFSGNEDNMSAPCSEDISVEGDAYEDEASVAQNKECLYTIGHLQTAIATEPEEICMACSEMEPYWSLVNQEENEEMFESGIEDYYAFQIHSLQTSVEQALNRFIMDGRSSDQILGYASRIEGDALLTELRVNPGLVITEVIELREDLANCCVVEKTSDEQSSESGDDSGYRDISRVIQPTLDLIHSVSRVVKQDDTQVRRTEEIEASEESTNLEEEQSDDESSEPCECEHCIPPIEEVPAQPLLPRMESNDAGKICVVIDLDETLVHSSFKPVNNADFIIPVEIDGTVHQVYVLKRPHVDEFLKRMGELFECVLFTASLSKYADPVSDLLDKWGAFRYRLFRESCVFHKGNYVKDLSRIGRDLNKVIIIDNSPASYVFHPDNAVPVVSWFDDMSDTELLDLIPFFERLSKVEDVYEVLQQQSASS